MPDVCRVSSSSRVADLEKKHPPVPAEQSPLTNEPGETTQDSERPPEVESEGTESSPSKELRPLYEGHNDLEADRINLVLAPNSWHDVDAFVDYA